MTYAVGSLVQARGREWVVLPGSDSSFLQLRPLGGSDEEIAGVFIPLEPVDHASFALPHAQPDTMGDARSCRLLRDAARLGFRASSGPFRSFGHIAVEPRPYQLVPLLMALKLDPVRLLIADDVGIGKTIEAALIARELLDRGEVRRMAVLCPPQLAEQWQKELREKFHIQAKLVLSSTVRKLEQGLGIGESIFDVYPHTIVSLDYIKAEKRRDYFLNNCPELVIVDEAHACASPLGGRSRQQRFDLIRSLAEDPSRHMLFVTATPHSGKNDVFHALLSFLKPDFANLPTDLSGQDNAQYRKQLSEHFIQRRRGDIRAYMDTKTPFPVREVQEVTWKLSPEYRDLLNRVLDYAREQVEEGHGHTQFQQRLRWWSALALLRSLASSPAAVAATLRNRSESLAAQTPEEADAIGRERVLDLLDDEGGEGLDVVPGGDPTDGFAESESAATRRRLAQMAKQADALRLNGDSKLHSMVVLVKKLLQDAYSPIIFCRFIPTAEYVAEHLRSSLRGVEVMSVTGLLPPAEREFRVEQMGRHEKRVLVCTDCLSEGINLQEHFDAVIHYDLSWNPTRHEQREGRVDRFGQVREAVRVITYYGVDNQIDGIVLDVLLRKHESIRKALGVSVPIPEDSAQVMQAILEGLLLRGKKSQSSTQQKGVLPGFNEYFRPQREALDKAWDEVAVREEKRSRTIFAQQSIKVQDVANELAEASAASGSSADVEGFVMDTLRILGAGVQETTRPGTVRTWKVNLGSLPLALKDRLPDFQKQIQLAFDLPTPEGTLYLSRTHPFVESLSAHVLDTALDSGLAPSGAVVAARRCGVVVTRAVTRRTTLLLLRLRFQLHAIGQNLDRRLLSEECRIVGFEGSPEKAQWLSGDVDQTQLQSLLAAEPSANISPDLAAGFVRKVVDGQDDIRTFLESVANQRAEDLLDAHRRVRSASRIKGVKYAVTPQGVPDILGIYVFLPHFD